MIVDSSGSPLHGYVLSGIRNVDMAMLHVVRDARAVAYSNRKDKINPSRRGSGARMQKKSTVRVALTWLYYNKMFESLKDKFNFGITKKYEELYSSPKSEFKNTAGKLGFQGRIMDVFKGDDKIFLNKGHNGQGNPIRYKSGNIKLEKDVKWERELSRTRKIVASLISYKGLKKYRYE
ncbi:hypothetical protein GGP96_002106 [Salinibacter ruber]|nr:hypothetical protein [Salinibacter ruber]